MKKIKNGFTLIELLVVVLIIGILAAVALPQYQVSVYKSRMSILMPLLRSIKDRAEVYYLSEGKYPASLEELAVLPAEVSILSTDTTFAVGPQFDIDLYNGQISSKDKNLLAGYLSRGSNAYLGLFFWLNQSSHPGRRECVASHQNSRFNQICANLTGEKTPSGGTGVRLGGATLNIYVFRD